MIENYVHTYFKKNLYMKIIQELSHLVLARDISHKKKMLLDPLDIKAPKRPKKNRIRDPHKYPKKSEKLTRHGRVMSGKTCG